MLDKIKSFISHIGSNVRHFFRRCNGPDNLGACAITTALLLYLIDSFAGTGVLTLLGFGLFCWTVFRMLSHNKAKRMEENRRFTQGWNRAKVEARHFFVRLKNSRKYKYYKCPNCKARLRMPRGIGEKTVTCSQCKTSFKQKA